MLAGALLFLMTFGVYVGAPTHTEHEHCPYTPSTSAMCATLAAHIDHWQSSTTGLVSVFVLVFAGLVVMFFDFYVSAHVGALRRKVLSTASKRPTLISELFASGLLHPRIP